MMMVHRRDNECSPSKRPRDISVTSFDDSEIVNEIEQALTTKQRLSALSRIESLVIDEHGQTTHIARLIETGIIGALILQLNFVLYQQHASLEQEAERLCNLLELFIRNGPKECRENLINGDGLDFLELLSDTLKIVPRLPIVAILHMISSSSAGTLLMLQCKAALFRIVELLTDKQAEENTLLELLGLLKNLSYYSEDQICVLMETPGMLSALTAFRPSRSCEKLVGRFSAILRNLAVSTVYRTKLSRSSEYLNACHELLACHFVPVDRNLLAAMISLSLETESCILLIFHGDGLFLQMLNRFFRIDDDSSRKRAVRLLRLWAANPASGKLLIYEKDLMDRISHLALHDPNPEIRREAADAFGQISSLVQSPMTQHQSIMDALVHLSQSSSTPLDVLARALRSQAAVESNRKVIAERVILVDVLARIAVDGTSTAKEDACCALSDLAEEPSSHDVLATLIVFEALVLHLRTQHREYAVKTILLISRDPAIRSKLISYTSFLPALIQYASSADTKRKADVKHLILLLVNEL